MNANFLFLLGHVYASKKREKSEKSANPQPCMVARQFYLYRSVWTVPSMTITDLKKNKKQKRESFKLSDLKTILGSGFMDDVTLRRNLV